MQQIILSQAFKIIVSWQPPQQLSQAAEKSEKDDNPKYKNYNNN